ncbi:glycerophosphodiester phosphodiesterase [Brevibacillus dissolubilis]|uniref:glycerophosphodiester phosphodiesterase n=1 Tax=Brevibacillus dissolubilis TaxID=1844116 RepID=UPI001116CA16|nr:glycerophosphodiester phosphodiesterase family protein [Brevibacillus dissolubilis]
MRKNPCMAHRGWSGQAPENTLAAITKALHHPQVDGIEFDVQLSRDGVPIVIHDFTLERTTNGRGLVHEHTFAELRALDAGSWYGPEFAGERIPTLEEVLIANTGKKLLNIELKKMGMNEQNGIEAKVIELIRRYELEQHVVVTSFNHESVRKVKELAPDLRVGPIIYGYPTMIPEQIKHIGASLVSMAYHYLTPELVHNLTTAGIGLVAWTIDESAHMAMTAELSEGIQICTNHPDRWFSLKG